MLKEIGEAIAVIVTGMTLAVITVCVLELVFFGGFGVYSGPGYASHSYEIPEPYYTGVRDSSLTFENLNDTINEAVMPHEYKRGVWDCSEGSAWIEWYLENRGFEVSIVTNRFPTGNHAYVKVLLPDGGVHLINCNSGNIHYYSNNSYYLYIHYDNEYADIYDAGDGCYSEWNWWDAV